MSIAISEWIGLTLFFEYDLGRCRPIHIRSLSRKFADSLSPSLALSPLPLFLSFSSVTHKCVRAIILSTLTRIHILLSISPSHPFISLPFPHLSIFVTLSGGSMVALVPSDASSSSRPPSLSPSPFSSPFSLSIPFSVKTLLSQERS